MSPADLDRLTAELWDAAHVSPAPEADDSEFLRRVSLDVAGRVPTLAEAERFLGDRAVDKRARLVDGLLAGPDYAEHWADMYLDLFVGRQFRKPKVEMQLDPRAYFVTAFRDNRRLDQIARDLLTFTGEIRPNGPGVFLASHLKGGGPEMAASAATRLFLGVQIQCAQCHDHPYDERYKQEDFYGLVAYFVRTKERQEKAAGGPAGGPAGDPAPTNSQGGESSDRAMASPSMALPPLPRDKTYFIIDKPNGQAKFRKTGASDDTVVRPRFLGRPVDPLPGEAPRQTLARAVVDSDLFAKTFVDRTWAQLFGRGIVEPWDDLGGERDPRHPPLLMRLAADFRASGCDIKHFLRLVLLSRAYGLTSRAPLAAVVTAGTAGTAGTASDAGATSAGDATSAGNAGSAGGAGVGSVGPVDPATVFARASVRRLTPEQLFQSLLVATGAAHQEPGGTEAIDRKIQRLLREYLFVFGDDELGEINTFNGNIPQALLLFNGEIVNLGARARPGGVLARILDASPDPETRLRNMFLSAYARPPTDGERARLLPGLTAAKLKRAAYEDVFFALLTSTEMLTIH